MSNVRRRVLPDHVRAIDRIMTTLSPLVREYVTALMRLDRAECERRIALLVDVLNDRPAVH